jgi:hypothetical protein
VKTPSDGIYRVVATPSPETFRKLERARTRLREYLARRGLRREVPMTLLADAALEEFVRRLFSPSGRMRRKALEEFAAKLGAVPRGPGRNGQKEVRDGVQERNKRIGGLVRKKESGAGLLHPAPVLPQEEVFEVS